MRLTALLLSGVLIVACSDDSPTAPTGPPASGPRSGAWVGTIVDPANGSGTLRLDLGERVVDSSTSVLSGPWSMSFADSQRNARGTLSGLATGTQWAALGATDPPATCPPGPFASPGTLSITATASTTEITGTFVYSVCTTTLSGPVALRRP